MRITPTKEQLAYLASIGVAEDTLVPHVHHSAVAEADDRVTIGRYSAHGPGLAWWFIIFLAVILALIAYSDGMTQEDDNSQSPLVSDVMNKDDSDVTQARLAVLEWRVDVLANLVKRIRKDAAPRLELVDLQQRLLLFRKDLDKAMSTARQINQDTLAALRTQLGAEETELRTFIRKKMETQANRTSQVLILLMIAGCLLTVFFTTGMLLMKKRLNQLKTVTMAQAIGVPVDGVRPDSGNKEKKPTAKPATPYDLEVKPKRPVPGPLLNSPRQTIELIIHSTACIKNFRVKPHHPNGHWTMGLSTAKGNVRSENQDYGLAFQMDDGHSILVVADGLGGIPLGQRAAHLASVTAAVSVLRTYGKASLLYTSHVRDAAAKAIKDAAY